MILFPNRTGQAAVYHDTSNPEVFWVDVAEGEALAGMRRFEASAASGVDWVDWDFAHEDVLVSILDRDWETGDLLGVLIEKDRDNTQLWTGRWDATNQRIRCVVKEFTSGTLTDGDAVNVVATPTNFTLSAMVSAPPLVRFGAWRDPHTASGSDSGKLFVHDSDDPVAIYLMPDPTAEGYQFSVLQLGAGCVQFFYSQADWTPSEDPVVTRGANCMAYVYSEQTGQDTYIWRVVA